MEERLFWIGLSMGLYAWGTRYGAKTGKLDNRWATALWHGAFCALAGFAVTLVAVMSIESRAKYQAVAVGILTLRELYPSLLAGAAMGFWGGWRAWKHGLYAEDRKYYHSEDLEWAETVFSAVLLAALMMYFIVQAFKIPSGSMERTLLVGDHLFVNKFVYGLRVPFTKKRVLRLKSVGRQDIVVFRFPSDDPQEVHCQSQQYGKDFIKRVIGLPGDEVKVVDGTLSINGQRFGPEPYVQYLDDMRLSKPQIPYSPQEYQRFWEGHLLDIHFGDLMQNHLRDNFGPVRVPPDSYFVMGDNRDKSCDSRFWGPVPDHYLKGKAWVIYWPPRRMGSVR